MKVIDTKPEYYKVIKHGKWKCTITIRPENLHLVRGFSCYSSLPESIPGRIQNSPVLAAHNCSLEIRSCVLWKKNILVFPLDASIRHHHSTWQRIDMGRPARIVLHLLRTSVDVPVPGWMKSESKLLPSWKVAGSRTGQLRRKGRPNHRTRPSVSPAIWSLGFPWSFCTWFWILRLGVKDGPETIPYLVYIQINPMFTK